MPPAAASDISPRAGSTAGMPIYFGSNPLKRTAATRHTSSAVRLFYLRITDTMKEKAQGTPAAQPCGRQTRIDFYAQRSDLRAVALLGRPCATAGRARRRRTFAAPARSCKRPAARRAARAFSEPDDACIGALRTARPPAVGQETAASCRKQTDRMQKPKPDVQYAHWASASLCISALSNRAGSGKM